MFFLGFLFAWTWVTTAAAQTFKVSNVQRSTLGTDPEGSARLNGMSFQQDALTSFAGWQYVAYYESTGTYNRQNIVLGRRNISSNPPSPWETFKFTDYVQRTQDSHNTISLGISGGDGRIHLSFDHHDVPLNYRVSQAGVALNPQVTSWSAALFGPVLHALPGAPSAGPWRPVTYPRFERVSVSGSGAAAGDLLFEMRIGASGAGDSYLYLWSCATGTWSQVGRYLRGSDNNAYINGLDLVPSPSPSSSSSTQLHISWTWRETPDVVTNHDLCYAVSSDLGRTWRNSAGQSLGTTISPSSQGINAFRIPQRSGILNQEGQAADMGSPSSTCRGCFHVLNRETISGRLTWMHYWRSGNGTWTRRPLTNHGLGALTQTGRRGKLAVHPSSGDVLAILPANAPGSDIAVMVSRAAEGFVSWTEVWRGRDFDVEPLIDRYRWNGGGGVEGGKTLSLFVNSAGGYPNRKVGVVDITFE